MRWVVDLTGQCQGVARCCFEPFVSSSGHTTLAIRVQKILKPVTCVRESYDGYIAQPREGQVLATRFGQKPICVQLKGAATASLRSLLPAGTPGYISKNPTSPMLPGGKHTINTLCPDGLDESNFMDISGVLAVNPAVQPVQSVAKKLQIRYAFNCCPTPFPLGTHGFFYYVRPKPEQPISGEVRFRITPDADPAGFTRGHDLLRPNGMPWALPIVVIAKNYAPLAECLIRDGTVERDQLRRWSVNQLSSESIVVRGFGEPFPVDFSRSAVRLWIAQGDALHSAAFTSSSEQRIGATMYPYTGKHGRALIRSQC